MSREAVFDNAQQVSGAIAEQSASVEAVAKAAQELNSMAEALLRQVNQFGADDAAQAVSPVAEPVKLVLRRAA